MFGLGTSELLLIAAAGLVIFGAKRLPEVGSALGKGLKNFKKALEGKESPHPSESKTTDNASPPTQNTPNA